MKRNSLNSQFRRAFKLDRTWQESRPIKAPDGSEYRFNLREVNAYSDTIWIIQKVGTPVNPSAPTQDEIERNSMGRLCRAIVGVNDVPIGVFLGLQEASTISESDPMAISASLHDAAATELMEVISSLPGEVVLALWDEYTRMYIPEVYARKLELQESESALQADIEALEAKRRAAKDAPEAGEGAAEQPPLDPGASGPT